MVYWNNDSTIQRFNDSTTLIKAISKPSRTRKTRNTKNDNDGNDLVTMNSNEEQASKMEKTFNSQVTIQ
jgi:hypothetical protein